MYGNTLIGRLMAAWMDVNGDGWMDGSMVIPGQRTFLQEQEDRQVRPDLELVLV